MRPAPLAELPQRDAIGRVALALIGLIVAPLALLAGEGHSNAHVSAGHGQAPVEDELKKSWPTQTPGAEKRLAPERVDL
jgi:hypothetical protein